MTIEKIDARRVRIALTAQDMQALGITQAALSLGGEMLSSALTRLLTLASEQEKFDCPRRRLLIEAYPAAEGGCVLYVTGMSGPRRFRRYRLKNQGIIPYLVRFDSAQALIDGCRAVFHRMSHRIFQSSLYYQSGFVLCVRTLDMPPSRVLTLLGEFSHPLGRGPLFERMFAEHARLIREQDAIDCIARHF